MKKILTVLSVLCLLCVAVTGYSDGGNARSESSVTANRSPAESTEMSSIDVDLTALSRMMVFAEVYHMMVSPDDYVGKTIKMSGPYYAQYYKETEQCYHYVIIEDATACCRQGLKFVWNGDHSYPDDYPADNTRIEVVGVFDSYEELGITYYHLVVDDVTIL